MAAANPQVCRAPVPGRSVPAGLDEAPRILVLDGLRGVAILLVVVCHYTHDWSSFPLDRAFHVVSKLGGLGVDLFFVLSGFLITGILLDAKGSAHYFRNFYVRRALRILPLYYGLVAFLVVLASLRAASEGLASTAASVAQHQVWYWTHTVNWLIALTGSFETTVPIELGILWSLAIEEQFYLCWPLVVFLTSPPRLLRACLGIIAGSYLLRIALCIAGASDTTISVTTFARLDPLAVGALVALVSRSPTAWPRVVAWASVIAAITGPALLLTEAWLRADESLKTTVILALSTPLWGSLLVLTLAAPAGGRWYRACSSTFLRQLGKYSYAMYLFHNLVQLRVLPRLGVTRSLLSPVGGSLLPLQLCILAIGLAVTFGAAYISWHLFEKHFLRLKNLFPSGRAGAVIESPLRHKSGTSWPGPST
jgi:peptidoglycan/LPS O-acetylase OafA/YrhL